MATCNSTLIVVSGLPGSCKTTVASAYVRASRAAFVRIDNQTSHGQPLGPVGYEIGYALASEQLRLGTEVVAECVNPLTITRDPGCAPPKDPAPCLSTSRSDVPTLRSIGSGSRPGRLTSQS
jgi:predicted kinase